MTTSSYTPATTGTTAAPTEQLRSGQFDVAGVLRRLGLGSDSPRRSRVLELSLDIAAVAFVGLAFQSTFVSAEFLFHCTFVVLVLHAFLFGLRGTLLRIGLVSIPLVIYADGADLGLNIPPLELTEWPLMFVIAILVAWMADRRNSTSRRYATLFRQASERLLTVEEAERRRVATELHDGVGQVLTALALTLDAAEAEKDVAVARRRVSSARQLAETALAGTRDLAHRLRPARIEERGLVAATKDLAAQSGFKVSIRADQQAKAAANRLAANTTLELYRIIQESLANAARHSRAGSAVVAFDYADKHLVVEIIDAGSGFDPTAVRDVGIGLAGMAERARLVGGQLSIISAPGAGTRVSVRLPLDAEVE